MRVIAEPMAVAGQPGPLYAMQPDHLGVTVVDHVRQVRGGHSRLATPGRAVIDENDGSSLPGQEIGGRHTSDPGADDADVRGRVGGQ